MRPRDVGLAVAVAAVWGINFVAIRLGLANQPPLLFNAMRFVLAAVPAVFVVRRPAVPWRWLVLAALTLAVGQFSFLFEGIREGMPAGLSSVVLQSQAIFTVVFAVVLLGERPGRRRVAGLAVATGGIVLVATALGPDRPAVAFALVLAAAASWGAANVVIRVCAPADMLAFMVWVSVVAAPILVVIALVVEGPSRDAAALRAFDLTALGSLAFIAWVSTLAGWGAWGALIRRYGAATVAPFSMLVPFFGIASTALLVGEPVHPVDVIGGLLVVGGVLFGAARVARAPRPPVPSSRDGRCAGDPLPGRGRRPGREGRQLPEPSRRR
jgi:O-acetylserine/cysteine efflux transporter